jgi:hypothetical protein
MATYYGPGNGCRKIQRYGNPTMTRQNGLELHQPWLVRFAYPECFGETGMRLVIRSAPFRPLTPLPIWRTSLICIFAECTKCLILLRAWKIACHYFRGFPTSVVALDHARYNGSLAQYYTGAGFDWRINIIPRDTLTSTDRADL